MPKNVESRFAATELTAEDTRRFLANAKKATRKVTATRESALNFLVQLGTHTKSGKLTTRYR